MTRAPDPDSHTPDTRPDTGPPMLSQAEAAKACGVSTATIRRARQAGKLEGVQPDGTGGYRIPLPSLIDAGLMDRTTPPDRVTATTTTPAADPHGDTVADLRDRLAAAERRAEVAEARAEERGKALDDARLALRALSAGSDQIAPADADRSRTPAPAPSPSPERRRRWWRRK